MDLKHGPSEAGVVLVMAPPWGLDTPPLGLAYISAYLRSHGCRVSIIDGCKDLYEECHQGLRYLWDFEQKDLWNVPGTYQRIRERIGYLFDVLVNRILAENPRLVGFSVNQNNRLAVKDIASRLREKSEHLILVAGGFGVFNPFERWIFSHENPFDYFVQGEGEAPLYSLVESLRLETVPPVGNGITKTHDSFGPFYHSDLSLLPGPTFEEFDLSKYVNTLPLLLTRGCVGGCAFCNDTVLMGPFRSRPIVAVVGEIEYHTRFNNIRSFVFNDLAINGHPRALREMCTQIIDSGLEISWSANAMPRKTLDYETLALMKRSGCRELTFGVESGSNRILRKMRKPFVSHEAELILGSAKELGITSYVNIIVGFPGEDASDFNDTLSFLERCAENIDGIGSLNTCNAAFNSFLREHPDKYDVVFSLRPEEAETGWYLDDGSNDLELRKKRLTHLMSRISSIGIPFRQANLFELKPP